MTNMKTEVIKDYFTTIKKNSEDVISSLFVQADNDFGGIRFLKNSDEG